jgi:hypothetical protein
VDIVWDKEREWPQQRLRSLLRHINTDWREERVSIDLYDKLSERHISKQDVWTALTSPQSYIARYWYYNGNRVGYWHPPTRVFVAWKPNKGQSISRLMTAFRHPNGVRYMQSFPPFREIRGPRQ